MDLKENKMGTLKEGRLLFSMAVPMMISMLVQAFYNVVDSAFVSAIGNGLGEHSLTAVSLAFPLQNLMIAVGGGTSVGMNALLSRSLGEKNKENVDRAAGTGIFLFICSSVIFSVVGIFLSKAFFRAQTDIPYIIEAGASYTSICLGFSIGIFCQFCFERLLQSTGKTSLSMVSQLTGAVINIVLDPIFIFGKCGVPAMGVKGAAIATVIGQIVAAIFAIILNIFCNKEITLKLSYIRFHVPTAKIIYKVGIPSIIMQSIGSVMTFCLNKILITFSTTATAVFGAYFKLQSFIFMPVFGLNNGMVPIIAYNFGAKKEKRVKKTIKITIITAITIMCVGALLFETIPDVLLSFFNAGPEMLTIGNRALRIIGTHLPLAGFCIIAGSVFQAIGNPVHSLIISVCRQLIALLPAAYLLSKIGILDLVWLAFPIAEVVSLTLSLIFLKITMKKTALLMNQSV